MTDDDLGKLWNVARYQGSWDAFVQTARAIESRVLAERKEPDCTCASNPHAETCPVTAHVRSLFKASGETAYATHPTPDDASQNANSSSVAESNTCAAIDRARQSGEEGNE